MLSIVLGDYVPWVTCTDIATICDVMTIMSTAAFVTSQTGFIVVYKKTTLLGEY